MRTYLVAFFILAACTSEFRAQDLVPVSPEDIDGYHSLVRKVLLGPIRNRGQIWMICRPSFRREYSVSIPGNGFVEAAIVKKQVWHYKDAEGGNFTMDLRADVEVERRKRTISPQLDQRISALWIQAVRRARYPDVESLGLDGDTYEFFGSPSFFGEAWSPEGGVAGSLAQLGEALFAFASDGQIRDDRVKETLLVLEKALKKP